MTPALLNGETQTGKEPNKMKNLVILGGGTAGTTVANQLVGKLPSGWSVSIVDPDPQHLFQPDLIFIPFGDQTPAKALRPRAKTFKPGVTWIRKAVSTIDRDRRQVVLDDDARLDYDLLVLATGSQIRPDETPGMLGDHWHRNVFDFYTLEGATALRDKLATFEEGRVAINIVEMPIKCPVAPLEFAFLADAYFQKRGIRDRVELVYVTPLDGAFTRPIASRALGSMLEHKGINVEPEFNTMEVDGENNTLRSYDEREVNYDLLVSIPTHMGAPFVEAAGLGDELAFVPTDPHNLLAKDDDHIFVLGDATNLPTSKAGSVAHFQAEVVIDNVMSAIAGQSLRASFDGHANCFIESGHSKAMLIDFNYDVEPLPGLYPWPVVGPMQLLKESRLNHLGKLAFRWVYWNMLLPGRHIPVPNHMSMAGKRRPTDSETPELAA
jgi:sulfide:quinone oxidoreductase